MTVIYFKTSTTNVTLITEFWTYLSLSALFLIDLSAITCLTDSIDCLACLPFNSLFSLEEQTVNTNILTIKLRFTY